SLRPCSPRAKSATLTIPQNVLRTVMIPHRKRVLLAGLFHETNTFLEGRTSLHDFAILLGRQLFDVAGDASPLAGVVEAAERLDWELIPLVDCRAMPGPIVATEVIETFWREYRARAEPELQRGID